MTLGSSRQFALMAMALLVLLGCDDGWTSEHVESRPFSRAHETAAVDQPAAGNGGAVGSGIGIDPETDGILAATGGTDGGVGDFPPSGGNPADSGVPSSGCGSAAAFTGESVRTIQVDGVTRTFILRVPQDYDSDKPYRLMIALHSLSTSPFDVASGQSDAGYEYYGISSRDDDRTIFVAPQGTGDPAGWFNWGGSDESFIMAMLQQLESELCIDSSRIFAEGFGFGAAMAYALACQYPDRLRAIVMHSGGPMSGCNESGRGPVAFFMTHGINDSVCTFPEYGVPQLNDFAQQNGCDPLELPTPSNPSGETPVCVDFQNCASGYPTRACLFVGDHTPSPPSEATTWVPDETWAFISQF